MAKPAKSSSFLGRWLGLAGVAAEENMRARRWASRLEWPMLFLALWMLITWYMSLTDDVDPLMHQLTDLVIWSFFLAETLLLVALVDHRVAYLKANWMNVVILLLGLPVLWGDGSMASVLRMLRVVLILSLLLPMGSTVHAILARNNLGTTLLISAIFIGLSGTFISVIDPAIDSPWEGVWWALVTVTTVGYGDLVPSSTTGKIFAAILILIGIGLFSLLTASFSVFFLSREGEDLVDKETALLDRVEGMEQRLGRLEDNISRMLEYQRQILATQQEQQLRDVAAQHPAEDTTPHGGQKQTVNEPPESNQK